MRGPVQIAVVVIALLGVVAVGWAAEAERGATQLYAVLIGAICGVAHGLGRPEDQEPGRASAVLAGERLDQALGPDPSRIAHGHGNGRAVRHVRL